MVMKRLVTIKDGVIGGVEKELIEKLLPQLVGSFRQRKEFFEYYFEEKVVEFSLDDLEKLSNEFSFELSRDELEIII
jgi:hypothetical protein